MIGDLLVGDFANIAFRCAPNAMALLDQDCNIVVANDAFRQILASGAKVKPGANLTDYFKPEAEDADGSGVHDAAAQASGREIAGTIKRMNMPDDLADAIFSRIDDTRYERFRCVTLRLLKRRASRRAGDHGPRTTPTDLISKATADGLVILFSIAFRPPGSAIGLETTLGSARTASLRSPAEAAVLKRLSPNDLCLRGSGPTFLICFTGKDEAESAALGATLVLSIRRESDGQPMSARLLVTGIARSFPVADLLRFDGAEVIRSVERAFESDRALSPARSHDNFAAALAEAGFDDRRLLDMNDRHVPIAFVSLPTGIETRLAMALAAMPDAEAETARLDGLYIRLGEAAAAKDIAARINVVYLVPVDYGVFRSRERLDAFMRECRSLEEPIRARLIFMIRHIPAGISRVRRQKALEQLQPFCKAVGVDLEQVDATSLDFGKHRVPLIACRANALIDAWRRRDPDLHLFLERRKRQNGRLIGTEMEAYEDLKLLAELPIDLYSLAKRNDQAKKKSVVHLPLGDDRQQSSVATSVAFQEAATGLFIVDISQDDQPIVHVNRAFAMLGGYAAGEIIGRSWDFLTGPETDNSAMRDIEDALSNGLPVRREMLTYRRDGTSFWSDVFLKPLADDNGRIVAYIGSQSDISDHVQSAAQHHALESFFRTVADAIPGFMFQRLVVGDEIFYPYISTSFSRLVGLPPTTKITSDIVKQHLHPEDLIRIKQDVSRANMSEADHTIEYRMIRTDGEVIWVRARASPRKMAEGGIMWTGVAIDISLEKSVEQNLSHLHHHDVLTGLLNRAAFRRILCDRVVAAQHRGTDCAVIDIDLVSFDEINDAFGRPVGDRILQEIAVRLLRLAGAKGVAARLGGDAFGMIVSDFDGGPNISILAGSLVQELSRPFAVDGQQLKIQSVAGASIFSQLGEFGLAAGEEAAEELIKRASVARHEARLSRSNMFAVYVPEIDNRIRKRARLRQSLHRAIDAEEFELYYQPIVRLDTGGICGAEALIRWNEPALGLQRPDQFIPLAEESGLIVPLGAWALRSAVRELRRWDEPGIIKPRIAVNVSGVQLQERDFVETVERTIRQGGIDPTQIELELTESFLIHESGRLGETLRQLRGLGLTITIDDFGTGYSSFQYLRELPATKVKIDQSFIRNLAVDSTDASIVRAMIQMAANLGLDVVVEGVETEEQRQFLIGEGCVLAQGYLFSVPLKAEDFFWMFESRSALPIELPQTFPLLLTGT